MRVAAACASPACPYPRRALFRWQALDLVIIDGRVRLAHRSCARSKAAALSRHRIGRARITSE